jgi:hypothetical protein
VDAIVETPAGIFAGTRNGVYRFAGDSWIPSGLSGQLVAALAFSETNRSLIAGVRPVADETTAAALFVTGDDGASWTPSDGGMAAMNDHRFWAYSVAVDPADHNHIIWGSSASLLASYDGGESWEFVHGSITRSGQGVNDVFIPPQGALWIAGTGAFGTGYAQRSDDRGRTWELLLPFGEGELPAYSIIGDPIDNVWIGMRGGIAETRNGGSTWEVVLKRAGYIKGMAIVDATVYAVSSISSSAGSAMRLFRLDRDANRWNSVSVPSSSGGIALVAGRDGSLLIGTENSGVWRFWP